MPDVQVSGINITCVELKRLEIVINLLQLLTITHSTAYQINVMISTICLRQVKKWDIVFADNNYHNSLLSLTH